MAENSEITAGEGYKRKRNTARGTLFLLMASVVWGLGFTAQKAGMEHIGPFTFNGIRMLIGSMALLPVIVIRKKIMAKKASVKKYLRGKEEDVDGMEDCLPPERKGSDLAKAGIACGMILFVASNLQQFGLLVTSPGKSGFITALYIVMVPLFGMVLGKKAPLQVWMGVVLSIVGFYFLCLTGGSLVLNRGDFLTLLCAVTFAFHILTVDHFADRVDGVCLACLQFFICGSLGIVGMFLTENPVLEHILAARTALLFSGLGACALGYTFQILGQQDADPVVAPIIMSLESVFSVLGGWLVLGSLLTGRELLGCVLVFAAVILTQLPSAWLKH